jgi:muramoyltetrapeptide carboxypeptidase
MPAKRRSGEPASIIPPPPQSGDTVGVIAPASPISKETLEAGCEQLRRIGYKIFFFESILERDLYFAGSHQRRAWELTQMFQKPFVKAIICARGGYGTNHLLPLLDLDVIRAHPKMFVGYSDVTTLLTWICDQTDIVTYHGPMVTKDYSESLAFAAISPSPATLNVDARQIAEGQCDGVLYGGCLSMLAASLGTPYEIETKGTILFIEDVATKPFQIDRMLMQLRYAKKFDDVRGVIFGEMADCVQPGGQDFTLPEIIRRTLGDLKIPIAFGLRSGHLLSHAEPGDTLPIGMKAKLAVSSNRATLSF